MNEALKAIGPQNGRQLCMDERQTIVGHTWSLFIAYDEPCHWNFGCRQPSTFLPSIKRQVYHGLRGRTDILEASCGKDIG